MQAAHDPYISEDQYFSMSADDAERWHAAENALCDAKEAALGRMRRQIAALELNSEHTSALLKEFGDDVRSAGSLCPR